jgi:MFS family permease
MDRSVSPETLIDENRIGGRQIAIVALCGLLAMAGFDDQAMACAAPETARKLGIAAADSGAVFAAGSFGSLISVLVQGPLGGEFGRMLGAFLIVSAASLLNVAASTSNTLIALRFVAGVGLGGALPHIDRIAERAETAFADAERMPRRTARSVGRGEIAGANGFSSRPVASSGTSTNALSLSRSTNRAPYPRLVEDSLWVAGAEIFEPVRENAVNF